MRLPFIRSKAGIGAATALLFGIGILGAPALFAQQAPDQSAEALEELIVTGSRIPAPNQTSTSPIVVVTDHDIKESGKDDISDIINQLPQNFYNGFYDLGNGSSSLAPTGIATADLRGLGPNRTLVLVDGIRLGQGSPSTFFPPAPDLDQIPMALLERVDVVTGGASATYGSDAIAGVINFIMKHDFEGISIDGQLAENWHQNDNKFAQNLLTQSNYPIPGNSTDGTQRNFNVVVGTNFADGKGNVTGYFGYMGNNPVAGVRRDWSTCQLNPTFDANGNLIGTACSGSSNSNWFEPLTGADAHTVYSVHGSSFVPYGSVATTPPAVFNLQQYNEMGRGDDRYTAGFLAHNDVTDQFKPYAEFYFMDDRTNQATAPAGLTKDSNPLDPISGNYNINCSNPLLSAQQAGILCTPAQIAADAADPGSVTANVRIGRRNIEGGPRSSIYDDTNYRAVLGSKGNFGDAWTYDLYGQYDATNFYQSNTNYMSFASIDNALLVTGTAANPVCISRGSCVPYNIFSDGAVTQQQLQYLYTAATSQGLSTLRTIHADITGELGKYGIKLPTANDGVAVNIGEEYRSDHEQFEPDAAEQGGLLTNFSAVVPIADSVSVNEQFIELRAPLIQDHPGVKELVADAGFRRSDYSVSGGVNTGKFDVQYAPVSGLRFRGSYQRAIRAPTIAELYTPQSIQLIQLGTDPCAPVGATPATATLAQCMKTGVTAAQYGNGGSTNIIPQTTLGDVSVLTGGGPKLTPERSDSYTFGVTLNSSMVPGLTGSIDYYRIMVKDEVGTIPASLILSQCLTTGDPTYCSQIVRNPNTGGLTASSIASGGYIAQNNINVGAALVSGIDLQFGYKLSLPQHWGSVAFSVNGSYLQHVDSTPLPGQHTYDCAGLFGATCQTVNPRWHHVVRTSWITPWNASASLTWRYIGKVGEDNDDNDPSLHFATYGAYDYFNATIPAYSYLDLAGSWTIPHTTVELRAGINNLLDKDPPLINSTIAPFGQNTYPTYDIFGRQVFIAFTAKFR